ncbi:hybrid sensor histidine kinase/response regulator [Desulfatibacillum aliphaticivorans]|uniref:hybrid sensor histidine kinase/response regulator n=1 Tax=Desulfatibacillum aliphaticivorans TaxID=218208 RepID=UPI000426FF5F|nr:PAS domain-containing sensor histidine kinase [Desulfatibacillum aliphaticivorans]
MKDGSESNNKTKPHPLYIPGGQPLDMEEQFRRRFFFYFSLAGFPALLGFGFMHLVRGLYLFGVLDTLFALFLIATIILQSRLSSMKFMFRMTSAFAGAIFLLWTGAGGTQGQPSIVLWAFVYPLLTFFLLGVMEGAAWTLTFLAGCLILFLYPEVLGTFPYVHEFKVRFFSVMFMIMVGVYLFEKTRIWYRDGMKEEARQLEAEKEKLAQEMKERQYIEDQLKIARDDLEKRVQERTKALAKSEESYRLLVDNAQDLIISVDRKGRLEWANEYGLSMLGYKMEDILGKTWSDLIVPEDLPMVLETYKRIFANGEIQVSGLEFRCIDFWGKPVWLSLNARIFYDKNGKYEREYGVARNTNRQKNLEAKLQHAQKMEAIGTLAGGIAHDFNNILMGIQGRASIMMLNLPKGDPSLEHLRTITELVQSSAGLTKQLLGLARGGKYDPKPTNLNDLVLRVASMFGRTHKEVVIKADLPEYPIVVEVDQGQVEQVFLNLYVNAWQAMPGGGDLKIRTSVVSMDEALAIANGVKPGQYAKATVTDSGEGMDEETRKRVFDPFFSTKGMGRGTGLGLSSAYGIIKNHGGFISVWSRLGEGSTFSIFIPSSQKAVNPESRIDSPVIRGEGTILLVDDEKDLLETGTEILENLGYKALSAGGGKEAVKMFGANREAIDLVVLDIVMPDMNGGAVFDKMKELNPNVKVLISSGYASDGKSSEIMKKGANGFIQKPFTAEDLSQKIAEILQKTNSSEI